MGSLGESRAVLLCLLAVAGFGCGGDGAGNTEPTAATTIAENGGNNQSAGPGNSVTTAPSVKVTDATASPVSGVAVTFAVTSGGGSITGANQTTDASGIATVGSWTLGPAAGPNMLTASAAGLDGSPVTFAATGTTPGAITFEFLAAGLDHTCGLTADGAAYCWGWNEFGQVGDGTTTNRLSPTRVAGDLTFQSLLPAGAHTCGVATGGLAYCWGRNVDGELGNGNIGQRLSPTPVSGGLIFQSLAGGFYHTCGLTPSGMAHCWGGNFSGQLGDGTTTSRLIPTAVTGGLTLQSLAGGASHTCGLTGDGAPHCWGDGSSGQMGNGTLDAVTAIPVAVAGGLTLQSLSAGAAHNCGVTAARVTHCWGNNAVGQIGDGTTTGRPSPVEIGTELGFQSVAMGNGQSCGITMNGTAYCWGFNTTGQVGDGSNTNRLTPVPVAGGLNFQSLTAGAGYHTCGLTTNRLAYCWGFNVNGGLGDGTTTDRLVPVPVAAAP